MKLVVVILGLNLSFQSLSSNSRFHATGHKDEDIIHIWPVTMFNFHEVLWSRGDLLIQAEPMQAEFFSVADMQIFGELSVILS